MFWFNLWLKIIWIVSRKPHGNFAVASHAWLTQCVWAPLAAYSLGESSCSTNCLCEATVRQVRVHDCIAHLHNLVSFFLCFGFLEYMFYLVRSCTMSTLRSFLFPLMHSSVRTQERVEFLLLNSISTFDHVQRCWSFIQSVHCLSWNGLYNCFGLSISI